MNIMIKLEYETKAFGETMTENGSRFLSDAGQVSQCHQRCQIFIYSVYLLRDTIM